MISLILLLLISLLCMANMSICQLSFQEKTEFFRLILANLRFFNFFLKKS